jgi:7-carboxy-7-deazaguanine synthase
MNVHSIFESISGEAGISIPQGALTTFIRLQGCNLKCPYCDTKDSQDPDIIRQELTIEQIIRQIHTKNVLITGGEPLLQKTQGLFSLINELEMNSHTVQIETNGSKKWTTLCPMGGWIVDYKCLSSHMWNQMLPTNEFVSELNDSQSIVKFVIDIGTDGLDILDYNFMWAKIFEMHSFGYQGNFIISPLDGKPDSLQKIAAMIQFMPAEFRSRIILSLQLHKICGLA